MTWKETMMENDKDLTKFDDIAKNKDLSKVDDMAKDNDLAGI